jgi:hypothetical protein
MSVDLTIANGVDDIVLNRPAKMNAFDDPMVAEMNARLAKAATAGVRALLIRGEGRPFPRAAISPAQSRARKTPRLSSRPFSTPSFRLSLIFRRRLSLRSTAPVSALDSASRSRAT